MPGAAYKFCLKTLLKTALLLTGMLSSSLLLTPSSLLAQSAPLAVSEPPAVVSETIDDSSVTLYRNPDRRYSGRIDRNWLGGYAVISETRTISLPKGRSTIRFTGVAEGMVAVSAIITGLPGPVIEKNRNKKLLSPGSLLDGSLGNRAILQRTNPATGKSEQIPVIIRSAANQALVLQTSEGIEALRCSGLPETPIFNGIPEDVFARPTLSIETDSPAAVTLQIKLTYIAAGFDWSAHYNAYFAPGGETLALSAWIILANSNGQSWPAAQILAIAGKPNVETRPNALADMPMAEPLRVSCWPQGSSATGIAIEEDIYENTIDSRMVMYAPPPPPMMAAEAASLMVKGSRIAQQEDLGDLKLYRVPFRANVNANGLKQLYMLDQPKVEYRLYYSGSADNNGLLSRMIRMENRQDQGLGLPLPAGKVSFYRQAGEQLLYLGEDAMADRAIDEKLELALGNSPMVQIESNRQQQDNKTRYLLKLTNANPFAIDAEITLGEIADEEISGLSKSKNGGKTIRRDGQYVWQVSIPANAAVSLNYDKRNKNIR